MTKSRLFWFAVFGTLTVSAGDRWYQIKLGGSPTGYMHESVEAKAGGTSTMDEMLFVINRMGGKVEIRMKSKTTEDPAGRMIAVDSETSTSRQVTAFHAIRKAAAIEVRTETGGKSYSRTIEAEGDVYGPEGAWRLTRERLGKPGDQVTYATFSAASGGVVQVTRTLKSRDAARMTIAERDSGSPGESEVSLDSEGRELERGYELPFGHVVILLADRETALRAAEGGELPAETWSRTVARSNVRLPDPRSIERVLLRVTHRRPELGWPAFEGPAQRVVAKSEKEVVLEVWRPALKGAAKTGVDAAVFLKPNALLQSDDSNVMRVARETIGDAREPFDKARRLQDWVAEHMRFGLGVAAAPASEAVRDLQGTCVAYSILLASLERAAGVSSRFAMGYVYVDGIWGAHAWTEVLVNGRWIPLDAAVYRPGAADAARFQFASYTLDDQMAAATKDGARMYGNIDVAVMEYAIGGRTVRVPEGARDYTIESNTYRNPWLGIAIQKPAVARFTTLDVVYPDATIVAVENGGAKVTVEQAPVGVIRETRMRKLLAEAPGESRALKVAGREGRIAASPSKSRVVLADGESLWVITAEGNESGRLLGEVLAGWKWLSSN